MRHNVQLLLLVAIGVIIFVLNSSSLLMTKSDRRPAFANDNIELLSSPSQELPSQHTSSKAPSSIDSDGVNEEADGEIRSERADADFTSADRTHMHGILGVDKAPLWTPTPLRAKLSDWTAEESRAAHEKYCFNHLMSDSLPLDRAPFDSRSLLCSFSSSLTMQPASVIFVFFDELLSTLLRSIHSALNTAPPHLIGEIVLIDDGSDMSMRPLLGTFLENYVKRGFPKTRLIRLRKRSGLMRARMHGAREAKFPNLIFLDSHIECSPGWIEPLLSELSEDYRNVALPVIESIEPHDFTKTRGGIQVLGHTWRLGQTSIPGRKDSENQPRDSPIMAGGLFAITKRWFDDLGQYDPEMQQYGGEEMEISFKIWQCGGKMRCIPCSRIGHVFRTNKYWQGQVYPVSSDVIARNKLRAAEVWMDEAAKIVGLAFSPLPATFPLGDVSIPRKVRDRLQCHDYNWYHKNVYPELFFPDMTNARAGSLRATVPRPSCVDTLMETQNGNSIGLYSCHYQHGTQAFLLTGDGMLRVAFLDFVVCLSLKADGPVLDECGKGKEWTFEATQNGKGWLKQSGLCMQAVDKRTLKSDISLSAAACTPGDESIQWEWVSG